MLSELPTFVVFWEVAKPWLIQLKSHTSSVVDIVLFLLSFQSDYAVYLDLLIALGAEKNSP